MKLMNIVEEHRVAGQWLHPYFCREEDRKNFKLDHNYRAYCERIKAFGGMDIGYRTHPSVFCAVMPMDMDGEDRESFYQVAFQFFPPGTLYEDQLKSVNELVGPLNIEKVQYDSTRGELEALRQQGNLPKYFKAQNFTAQKKHKWAGQLNLALEQGRLKLFPEAETEMTRSLLQVDELLKADDSPFGHGDVFWALALALDCAIYRGSGIWA